jgi:hypothetical protein
MASYSNNPGTDSRQTVHRAPLIQPLFILSTFRPVCYWIFMLSSSDWHWHILHHKYYTSAGYLIQFMTRVRIIQPRNCGSIWARIQKVFFFCTAFTPMGRQATFPWVKRLGREMTTHLYAVPNLKIIRALESPCTFMACTGTTLPFLHSR